MEKVIKINKKDPYEECPVIMTEHFMVRLVSKEDSKDLFQCYHDQCAVQFMNDDNCDFGFYVESEDRMAETIGYWLDFYKSRAFIRFAIVDCATNKAVGTIEGFADEVGVLRVDIRSEYEKMEYLCELFAIAKDKFKELFQNKYVVTKAIPEATERRKALEDGGWKEIDEFRTYKDYYRIEL